MPKRKTVKPLLIDGQDRQCILKDSERTVMISHKEELEDVWIREKQGLEKITRAQTIMGNI